jgi:hypothetical protein
MCNLYVHVAGVHKCQEVEEAEKRSTLSRNVFGHLNKLIVTVTVGATVTAGCR